MRAVLIGVLCGTVVAVALTRFLTAYLYSVTPTDPITFGSVVLVFIGVALISLLSVPFFLKMSPDAGAEVSGRPVTR